MDDQAALVRRAVELERPGALQEETGRARVAAIEADAACAHADLDPQDLAALAEPEAKGFLGWLDRALERLG